jgi:hypothetical protein
MNGSNKSSNSFFYFTTQNEEMTLSREVKEEEKSETMELSYLDEVRFFVIF